MAHWSLVKTPPICERLIGFSVPVAGVSLVVSYEGVHLLHLGEPITVETDVTHREYDLYDPDAGTVEYHGVTYRIIGLHGGTPLSVAPQGDRIEFDPQQETLAVVTPLGRTLDVRYENFSGDWAAATFSPDGKFLLLGCPYDFDFRVWRRCDGT